MRILPSLSCYCVAWSVKGNILADLNESHCVSLRVCIIQDIKDVCVYTWTFDSTCFVLYYFT